MSPPRAGRFSFARLRRAFTLIENLDRLGDAPHVLEDIRANQLDWNAPVMMELRRLRDDVAILRRSHDLLARRLTLPPEKAWAGRLAAAPSAPPEPGARWLKSQLCRQESLEDPAFLHWMRRLRLAPAYHRKHWEFGFVAQALWERNLLWAGSKGLGFGVGGEPLSALFAAEGCTIVGTDLAAESAAATGWIETDQHAAGKEGLRRPAICDDALFDERVSFRPVDMNAIDEDLRGFDFCWSACALEHLGSIAAGLAFITRSLDTLKPGGWAVHTTEFRLGPGEDTIEAGPTVLFRRSDLEGLMRALRAEGHFVENFDWASGEGELDRYVDLPPYLKEPHLKLLFDGYPATSVGIIIRKAG